MLNASSSCFSLVASVIKCASSSESKPSCGPFIFFTLIDLPAASGVAGASVEDDCDRLEGTLVGCPPWNRRFVEAEMSEFLRNEDV